MLTLTILRMNMDNRLTELMKTKRYESMIRSVIKEELKDIKVKVDKME